MKVVLPRPATGNEIAEAFSHACAELGWKYSVLTSSRMEPGSAHFVPDSHHLDCSTRIGKTRKQLHISLGRVWAEKNHEWVSMIMYFPEAWDPTRWPYRLDETDKRFVLVEPSITLFFQNFFAELQ